ncbi:hypothetical protein GCM10009727_70540 [Actinomadura napierensis]|uniref:Uncharacterized protein n=1 Tax=Actinomadura napierensis TaxID=267854 RepID=A0ABN3ABL4_9ACTN
MEGAHAEVLVDGVSVDGGVVLVCTNAVAEVAEGRGGFDGGPYYLFGCDEDQVLLGLVHAGAPKGCSCGVVAGDFGRRVSPCPCQFWLGDGV